MRLALYDELVPWYRLLDPLADHEDEATVFTSALRGALGPGPAELLELGAGAGNGAYFLKRSFRCTLTDLSTPMLALSQEINPECAHVAGDMRTLRLDRELDAVFVHDAICYMLDERDLAAVAETAFVHTRRGGAALFVPDCVRETFEEATEVHEGIDGSRALRCLAWMYDPSPSDTTYTVDYAFLLRDGAEVRAVHDRHVEGLFDRATWRRVLEGAGFVVETIERPLGDVEAAAYTSEAYLCRRP